MMAPMVHQEQLVHRQVPVVHEKTVEVPQAQVQERIIHKPVTIIQEREIQVP